MKFMHWFSLFSIPFTLITILLFGFGHKLPEFYRDLFSYLLGAGLVLGQLSHAFVLIMVGTIRALKDELKRERTGRMG